MDRSWRLVDGEERAAAHPRTFFIPDAETRAGLQPGDLAKLVFELTDPDEGETEAERMWVEVTDRAPGGYVGTLANDPVVIEDLQVGARVEFEPRHVIQVPADEPDPYDGQTAFASERLFEDDDLPVGVATFEPGEAGREAPYGRVHSGWSFFAGDETEDELDDPSRIRMPNLAWLLERYPELRPLLDSHSGDLASYAWRGDRYERL